MGNASFPVIINRPKQASERFAEALRRSGVSREDLIVSPVIAIVDTVSTLALEEYSGAIFTSANAVRALAKSRIPAEMKAFCVGGQTGKVASNAGFQAIVADGSAEALCRLILETGQRGPLLFARGGSVAIDVTGMLTKQGVVVVERVVYVQERQRLDAVALSALTSRRCIVPLFSARTARIFGEQASALPNPGHVIVGISPKVTREFPLNWRRVTADSPNAAGMAEAVIRTWKAVAQQSW